MKKLVHQCAGLPQRSFAAGETIIEQGRRSGVLYILAEGSVEVLKGDFQISIIDSVGSIFGEVSVLLDLPHTATVKAMEPCRFFIADEPAAFLKSNPEAHLHLSRLLAKRLNAVTTYLVDLKRQFEDQEDHLGMVDEVLDSLVHHQSDDSDAGDR